MRPLPSPANARVLAYLAQRPRASAARTPALPESCAPETVADPYMRLGTHPDIVQRLWDELDAALPARCRWVAHGAPVLAHPDTGVIFGLAGGTVYALRLPGPELAAALAGGAEQVHHFPANPALGIEASILDLRELGPGWVFGRWDRAEPAWCRVAFDAAASGTFE